MRTLRATPVPLRVGDAEREQTVADLGRHYAAGRLTDLEHEERVAAALSARTEVDLGALVADLPLLPQGGAPGPSAGAWRRGLRLALWVAFPVALIGLAIHLAPILSFVLLVLVSLRVLFGWPVRHHRRRVGWGSGDF